MSQTSIINYDLESDFEATSDNAVFTPIGLTFIPLEYSNELLYTTFRTSGVFRPERFDSSLGTDNATVVGTPTITAISTDYFSDINRITKDVEVVTNLVGYFELAVVETETAGIPTTFTIEYTELDGSSVTTQVVGIVPRLSSCSLNKIEAGICHD